MLWIMPGRPRKWSPWKCVRKTRETCMKLSGLCMNWRCVPSPQSNRMTSGPRFTATALTFRFGVGQDPEVPRNTISMDLLPNARGRLTPLEFTTVALGPSPFETPEAESGEELERTSEGEPRDERDAKFQAPVLPEADEDLGPSDVLQERAKSGGMGQMDGRAGKREVLSVGSKPSPA